MKMDLALNNLQRLICHKTHPDNQPTNTLTPTPTHTDTNFMCIHLTTNIYTSTILKYIDNKINSDRKRVRKKSNNRTYIKFVYVFTHIQLKEEEWEWRNNNGMYVHL